MAPTKSIKGKEVQETNVLSQKKASATTRAGKRSSIKHQREASSLVESGELPGVQKIKRALRQTKRLLAKDNLTADLRVTTERRLKSLEDDLASAELARKERSMATRYHKVKFFERKKVIRKLNQVKRSLETADDMDELERKQLEMELLERRVDLNYILHFPKTRKYSSLFPSEMPKGEQTSQDPETSRRQGTIRFEIRSAMLEGTLPMEPELEVKRTVAKPKYHATPRSKSAKGLKGGADSSYDTHGIEGDMFFEDTEDNHNHDQRGKSISIASDDTLSNEAMSD